MLKSFCDEKLGKGVIICNDTPGFLGNRVGVYAIQVAMTEAFKMGFQLKKLMQFLDDRWEYLKQEYLGYMI